MASPSKKRRQSGDDGASIPNSGMAETQRKAAPTGRRPTDWSACFAAVFGLCICLVLIKLGNPIILDRMVEPPATIWEVIYGSWPVSWGHRILVVSILASLPALREQRHPWTWLGLLPALWFGWQLLAATQTIDPRLTLPTIAHFGGCIFCFLLGWRALSHGASVKLFWVMILAGFVWVLWTGFTQHFGGLESTRRMILEQGNLKELPSDYLKRIESGRIFSTFVYPNALAGAILLLLTPLTVFVWQASKRFGNIPRGIATGLLVYAGLACLLWSGSKSGWLIALCLASLAVMHFDSRRKTRLLIIGILVLAGLTLFTVRYQGYFKKGATSVGARLDYWSVAWKVACSHPFLGSGPGTFSIPYRELKAPESEMTRLVHNDYLEQASDSGWLGLLAYSAFIISSIVQTRPRKGADPLRVGAWLGVVGFALQGFVEFGLYIPATAWTAFAILGWLWAAPNGSTFEPLKPNVRPK